MQSLAKVSEVSLVFPLWSKNPDTAASITSFHPISLFSFTRRPLKNNFPNPRCLLHIQPFSLEPNPIRLYFKPIPMKVHMVQYKSHFSVLILLHMLAAFDAHDNSLLRETGHHSILVSLSCHSLSVPSAGICPSFPDSECRRASGLRC